MIDNDQVSLPPLSSLRPQGWNVEVEVITKNLTSEQTALVVQVKQLNAMVIMAGYERAKRLKLLRDSFAINYDNINPDTVTRMGWADFLRREFDTNVRDVNYEIIAIEAGEQVFSELSRGGPAPPVLLNKIGSTHLNEIGRGLTTAIRCQVWDSLLEGKVNLNKKSIRAAVKDLNTEASRIKLSTKAPNKPAGSPPKLPIPKLSGDGKQEFSLKKWTESPGASERMDREINYLHGKAKQGLQFEEDLTSLMRKAGLNGSIGKLNRIKALSAALHREFKSFSDRYQKENEHTRDWKCYMTVWRHHWEKTDQFNMHTELNQIQEDLVETNRHFEITLMLSWSDDVHLKE